jgi:PST family polysaccharide transporter
VLARLLVPDDFGLIGMALFFIGIGQLFADFGIGSAIVQSRSSDDLILSSCFWLNLVIAAGLALAVLVSAPLVAQFYGRGDLVPLVAALSVNLLLAGLLVVPQALLYQEMRFADIARAQVLGSLAASAAAIVLAWSGAGVWALVAQPVVGSTVNFLACLHARPWRPRLAYSWPQVKPLARFSLSLLGANLVGYANRNTDSLIIGRFLGAGPLGIYSMAMQIMLYPLQQVSSVIVRVLFPALVQIRDDLPRLRAAYLTAVGAIAFVTFPMMAGLFAVAEDFVLVVFGTQWSEMVPVIRILAWVGMMQSVGTTVGTIYLSMGRPDIALRVSLVAVPVVLAGVLGGLPWGIRGVAAGYAVGSFSLFYYSVRQAFLLVDLDVRLFWRVLIRPLLASVGMVALIAGADSVLAATMPAVRLGSGVSVGLLVYVTLSILVNREQVADLVARIRMAVAKTTA